MQLPPDSLILPAGPSAAEPAKKKRSLLVRLLRLWPFPAIVLIGLAIIGWQRQTAGGATGPALSGAISPAAATQAAAGPRFRVGIYNIEGAIGKDDPAVIDKLGQTLSSADICGLTEVRANFWHSDHRNQAQQIGEALGRAWLFAPAERRFWLDAGGNGVISRVPAGPWVRLPLPNGGDSSANRNVILLRAAIGGRPVNVLVTHLDRGVARADEIAAITQLFQSIESPAVLLADLNTKPLDPLLNPLLQISGVSEPIGKILGSKDERVDWILCKGLTAVDAGRTDDPASDHSFFWADLEFPR